MGTWGDCGGGDGADGGDDGSGRGDESGAGIGGKAPLQSTRRRRLSPATHAAPEVLRCSASEL